MLRRVALVRIGVSEEYIASIIRVKIMNELMEAIRFVWGES
jgi:hypothetical protein